MLAPPAVSLGAFASDSPIAIAAREAESRITAPPGSGSGGAVAASVTVVLVFTVLAVAAWAFYRRRRQRAPAAFKEILRLEKSNDHLQLMTSEGNSSTPEMTGSGIAACDASAACDGGTKEDHAPPEPSAATEIGSETVGGQPPAAADAVDQDGSGHSVPSKRVSTVASEEDQGASVEVDDTSHAEERRRVTVSEAGDARGVHASSYMFARDV